MQNIFRVFKKFGRLRFFFSYTMYYENLLRGLHQNLYQKEQEGKQMRDQLKNAQVNAMVEVQCQLANQGHDLIMGELFCNRKLKNQGTSSKMSK